MHSNVKYCGEVHTLGAEAMGHATVHIIHSFYRLLEWMCRTCRCPFNVFNFHKVLEALGLFLERLYK